MMVLLRLILLWIALTISSHSLLSSFWQGRVAQQTLVSGADASTLRFYGFLAAFGISVYYFWSEMSEWRAEMLAKVLVGAVAVALFLVSLSGLESLDQAAYREMASYQTRLLAGLFQAEERNLKEALAAGIPLGATPATVLQSLPGAIEREPKERKDGTSYQDYYYWLGTGTLPLGVHVSYSTPPLRVTEVEAVPRQRPGISQPPPGMPFRPESESPSGSPEGSENGP